MRFRVLLIFSIGFACGIAVASYLPINLLISLCLCVGSFLVLIANSRLIVCIVFIAGVAFGCLRYDSFFPPGWSINRFVSAAPVTMTGTIISEPSEDGNKALFLLRCSSVKTHFVQYKADSVTSVLVHGAAFQSFNNVHTGDDVQLAGILQNIVPPTNPGEFDWQAHYIHRGVAGELVVQRPHGVVILRQSILLTRYLTWSTILQKSFEGQLSNLLPSDEAGVVDGILFGDRHGISPELNREFASTGTAHILATAGLHVGVLALVLTAILLRLPLSRPAASVIITAILWAFALVAGGRPPVIRAVFAATLYYGGRIFRRVPDAPTTIAAAVLAILAIAPTALFESDFQLTFVTVTGLSLFMGRWHEFCSGLTANVKAPWMRRFADATGELVGFSAIAQLSSAPLIIYYFGQLSLLSLPTNLLVVPLLFVIIPSAALTLTISFFNPTIASGIAQHAVHPLLWLLLKITHWFAALPFCCLAVATPSPLAIIGIYSLVFGIGLWMNTTSSRRSAKSLWSPSQI